jgi:hypothetical protein
MTEAVLFTTTQISTFDGNRLLTRASGFFFERDTRLYLITSGHEVFDEASGHHPDRIEFGVHRDRVDLTATVGISVPLYRDGKAAWRAASDTGGPIDVAAIPLERAVLAGTDAWEAFRPEHLEPALDAIEVGTPLLVVGFPLGFHDTVHHLPVVRQAGIASSFGVRFQGQGYFLTDARTHRGTSGAPVVMRAAPRPGVEDRLPWRLLGVHAARMDVGSRDREHDESLGLNCAWYADVLMVLTRA